MIDRNNTINEPVSIFNEPVSILSSLLADRVISKLIKGKLDIRFKREILRVLLADDSLAIVFSGVNYNVTLPNRLDPTISDVYTIELSSDLIRYYSRKHNQPKVAMTGSFIANGKYGEVYNSPHTIIPTQSEILIRSKRLNPRVVKISRSERICRTESEMLQKAYSLYHSKLPVKQLFPSDSDEFGNYFALISRRFKGEDGYIVFNESRYKWTPLMMLQLFTGMCRQVSMLHLLSIIHNDLKLENFIIHVSVDNVVTVRLVDLGMARHFGYRYTIQIGTPLTMSPEMWSKLESVNYKTDIFSLWCVMLEIIGGVGIIDKLFPNPKNNLDKKMGVMPPFEAIFNSHSTCQFPEPVARELYTMFCWMNAPVDQRIELRDIMARLTAATKVVESMMVGQVLSVSPSPAALAALPLSVAPKPVAAASAPVSQSADLSRLSIFASAWPTNTLLNRHLEASHSAQPSGKLSK